MTYKVTLTQRIKTEVEKADSPEAAVEIARKKYEGVTFEPDNFTVKEVVE